MMAPIAAASATLRESDDYRAFCAVVNTPQGAETLAALRTAAAAVPAGRDRAAWLISRSSSNTRN
jgi:hypothetical protein